MSGGLLSSDHLRFSSPHPATVISIESMTTSSTDGKSGAAKLSRRNVCVLVAPEPFVAATANSSSCYKMEAVHQQLKRETSCKAAEIQPQNAVKRLKFLKQHTSTTVA